jgi:hypothetical protein
MVDKESHLMTQNKQKGKVLVKELQLKLKC